MMNFEKVLARGPLRWCDFGKKFLIGGQGIIDGDKSLKMEGEFRKEDFKIFLTFDIVFDCLGSFFWEYKVPFGIIKDVVVDVGVINVIEFFDHLVVDVAVLLELMVASLGGVDGFFVEVEGHEGFISFGDVLELVMGLIPFS